MRERKWSSAAARIVDARIHPAVEVSRGMLYDVEVLARYRVGEAQRQEWTTLSQLPKAIGDAQLQAYLLRGRECVVYWRPADPGHVIAEIN